MRQETTRYKVLAMMMALFFFGGLLRVEQATVNLLHVMAFCMVSGILLLYALIKLGVMEFQPDSFWYQVEQYLNREEAPDAAKPSVQRSVLSASAAHK